ncbi:MAG: MBL fold metallo-hydrolase [Mycobacteriales bacterium]
MPVDPPLPSGVFRFRDTCNVYLLRTGRDAVLIDFGDGDVLDHLADYGVDRVTDVLVTHHHRDQVQGLARAAAAGIRIWVPPVERDLFDRVDEHWQARQLDNDYNTRDDRFSLLEPVPVTGVAAEYRTVRYGGMDVTTLPTPGHTVGSVSYLVQVGGRKLAFTGDLLHGDPAGRLWSLAATQWTYSGPWPHSGAEGVAATGYSCLHLLDEAPDLLLPAHGEPVTDPATTLRELRRKLRALLEWRNGDDLYDLERALRAPWAEVLPHLLRNVASNAITYALLSESGAALLFDFGYDLTTGLAAGGDRASRRPLLNSIDVLRRQHGVTAVEVAMPTHYHDDHVAGMNLLREVHGTQVWSPANVTPVLTAPTGYDLPCLWYDPIPVDRDLPLGGTVRWHEYEITTYELPGHTLYAAAYALEVDGRRVVVTGDQQSGEWMRSPRPENLNYQYRNRFRVDDFVRSAELYVRLRPDLMVSGHWEPRAVTDAYLAMLLERGQRLAELHRELLPLDTVDLGAEGFAARLEPYRSVVRGGEPARFSAWVRNPLPVRARLRLRLVTPEGWKADPVLRELRLGPGAEATVSFGVYPPATPVRRARIAVDLTAEADPAAGEPAVLRLGQQAEALVTVE